ncbi:MAG: hypothetical protein HRT58_21970 [Crocinitomicaceae bacterium]|nr:hypothetical protein [Flavobacteriales bacterium]MCJ8288370.1 hypothetical protein [Flavobacteriales bacterium]NQZ38329.1 hypothetical protein [Crocinitomicaceae bacterium]NQZ38343.1 hypothetical protein [Crocinitomicaceae bacterium]
MNFKQAVITTNFIIEGSPILEVIRDEDGDWQFLGGQEITEENAVVLSLEQIIAMDNTLMGALTIDESCVAYRANKESKWVVQKT